MIFSFKKLTTLRFEILKIIIKFIWHHCIFDIMDDDNYMENIDEVVKKYNEGDKNEEEMIKEVKNLTKKEQIKYSEKHNKITITKILLLFGIFLSFLVLFLLVLMIII